jgi:hypothetical protein
MGRQAQHGDYRMLPGEASIEEAAFMEKVPSHCMFCTAQPLVVSEKKKIICLQKGLGDNAVLPRTGQKDHEACQGDRSDVPYASRHAHVHKLTGISPFLCAGSNTANLEHFLSGEKIPVSCFLSIRMGAFGRLLLQVTLDTL